MTDSISSRGRKLFAGWREAIFGGAAAVVVYSVPYIIAALSESRDVLTDSFLTDKKLASAVSFTLLFVGALLSLNRHETTTQLNLHLRHLEKLHEMVDLSQHADYSGLTDIVTLYSRISNPYFAGVKNELLSQFKVRLSPMATQGMSPPLSAGVYTQGEHQAFEAAIGTKTRIRAIATLFEGDFDQAPTSEETEYVATNARFVHGGGDFERLFVIDSSAYADALKRPTVRAHVGEAATLPGRVVFIDLLRKSDPELAESIGAGFLLLIDIVAFLDTPSVDRRERGQIVVDRVRLAQYERLYGRLRAYSYPIETEKHPLTNDGLLG